jgi:Domain of unknown function (DUF4365)
MSVMMSKASDMIADELLNGTDKEGLLCELYVNAIATMAGYTISKYNLDKDGVDVTISAGGDVRPKIDIQCKGTFNLSWKNDEASFPLPIRNYNLLRLPVQTPRLLVVLDLPKNSQDWMSIGPTELIMRKCAHWLSLRDAPECMNAVSKTILLSAKNRFDTEALKILMEQSRSGMIS